MPVFTRKRDHGPPDLSWWNSNPTTGPTGTATTWVGIHFSVDVAAKLTGLAFYDSFAAPGILTGNFALAQVNDPPAAPVPVAVGKFVPRQALSVRWQFIWFHPQPILAVGGVYQAAVLYIGGGFYRNTTFLPAGGTVRNHIKLIDSWQTTALDVADATLTTNLNANAIDPLIKLV